MKKFLIGASVAAIAFTAPTQAAVNGTVAVTVAQDVPSVCGTLPFITGNTPSLYLGGAGSVTTASLPVSFFCNSRYGMDVQLKSEKSGMKEGDENGINAIDYTLTLVIAGNTLVLDTAGNGDSSPELNITDTALLDFNSGLTGDLTLTTDGSAPTYSGLYSDTITLSITAGGSFGSDA